ncbi:MAG: glycosyltransferase family protein [Rhodospirillales bacterium]|nr:glycosyltransferase family protein [Rhodospirillales bacterium]
MNRTSNHAAVEQAPVTGVVIQARIGSTRLPGKVLMDLGGRTVLSHVIERCQAIEGVDVVACAVPKSKADDPVAEEATRNGAAVFRGAEKDVLGRVLGCARAQAMHIVMRITADCPLLDPTVCAGVLRLQRVTGADYVSNDMKLCWPRGLDCEVVTRAWLERAAEEATDAEDREHVTRYIRRHPEVHWEHLPLLGKSVQHIRLTLDTEDDLRDLRRIVATLPPGRTGWGYDRVLRLVAADPELAGRLNGRGQHDGLWMVRGI